MQPVKAIYFDGKSARAHAVTLALADGRLEVRGEDFMRTELLENLRVSEPMGEAPRLIKFADGAHCEVRDHVAFAALLELAGHEDKLVVRLQSRWRWALAAVLIAVVSLAAGYRWGLPAISEWIAFRLPDKALAQMGESTLAYLDESVFAASKLPEVRQQSLQKAFAQLTIPDQTAAEYAIVFRDSPPLGPNALALPDGTIVVTDQLVRLAGHDEEILGVLAHELGHLKRRHSLRMLIQGSIVGTVIAWYIGDVSSVAAGLPTLLLQMRYSRDHEREADDYAANMLKQNGISPKRLATILARLEKAHDATCEQQDRPAESTGLTDYFSSHPATRERIQALED